MHATIVAVKLSDELDDALSDAGARIRLRYPWWLRPLLLPGTVAITLGRRIYVGVEPGQEEFERLLRHELQHVRQINKLGVFRFYSSYALEFLHNIRTGMNAREAYCNISFEREAHDAEGVRMSLDV